MENQTMSKILGLGHTVIYVSDLAVSRAWYQDILGMEVVIDSPERNGCFLSFGTNDHDIALFENPVAGGSETIHHIALKFGGDIKELSAFRQRLIDKGVDVQRTVDHGISYGIYFLDPDGHCWEVFLERQRKEATRLDAMRATGAMSDPVELEAIDA
jgi:catechol 2,3-dioxygenase